VGRPILAAAGFLAGVLCASSLFPAATIQDYTG
jgi:hypothetical protein